MKIRKGQVKTYVLDENGTYKLLDQLQEQEETENTISLEELPNKINEVLHTNPFLLINNTQIKSQIDSIEEFYIKYNEKEIQLLELIRDDLITKKEKIYILKKQFKNWQKEAIYILNVISEKNEKQFLESKPEKFRIIKSLNIFYIFISFALSTLILFNVFGFINKGIITGIIIASTIIFSIISIILTIIQNKKIKKYDNNLKNYFLKLRTYIKKTTKVLKKNYKKLKKYYFKNYNNNMFSKEPYDISKVYIDMKTYNNLRNDNENIIKDYNLIIKENKGLNIYYHFPLIASYILMIVNGGYIVIMLLINLFKLIFMKGE